MRNFVIIVVIIAVALGVFIIYKNINSTDNLFNNSNGMQTLKFTSKAFEKSENIPPKYTCDGENISPPLEVQGIPKEAVTLVLVVDDPDAPMGVWNHWVKFNIPVAGEAMSFKEGKEPAGISGKNSGDTLSYQGPCPPDKEHRYFFKIYALNSQLNLPEEASKQDVEKAMKDHIIASGELMGKYDRIK